jgi:hypothetical protein
MRCPSCSSTVTGERRFCPSCGTPLNVSTGTRVGAAARGGGDTPGTTAATAGTPGPAASASPFTRLMTDPPATAPVDVPVDLPVHVPVDVPDGIAYDEEEVVARQERTTRVLPVDPAGAPHTTARAGDTGRRTGRGLGDRLAPAGDAVRRRARDAADRYRHATADVRLALVGTVLTVVAFLALPYADEAGTAARLGARLWWRPIAAVVATVLLAAATKAGKAGRTAADRLLAAVTVAAVGATEAGLVGLFSGDAAGARIGYYVMLAGLVMVLVAAVRAARRHCGTP